MSGTPLGGRRLGPPVKTWPGSPRAVAGAEAWPGDVHAGLSRPGPLPLRDGERDERMIGPVIAHRS